MSYRQLVLLLGALGSAGPVLAQRPAIAPLAPAVVAPPLGVNDTRQATGRPAAPVPDQRSRTSRPEPVYLINSRLIVGNHLSKINPQDIADLQVYKGPPAPAKWLSLNPNGIIAITLKPHAKPKLKATSLAAIRRGLKLRGPVSYQLEGLPIEDLALRVATADITRLDTVPTPSGMVVNIHLATMPPVVHPPGTIMIRGASGF